jgi:hypothetical protein
MHINASWDTHAEVVGSEGSTFEEVVEASGPEVVD